MRLIDADILMADFQKAFPNLDVKSLHAKALLATAPTVEAVPVKHGRWVKDAGEWWHCSECGQQMFSMSKQDREEFHKWCGRCGARMDKVEE